MKSNMLKRFSTELFAEKYLLKHSVVDSKRTKSENVNKKTNNAVFALSSLSSKICHPHEIPLRVSVVSFNDTMQDPETIRSTFSAVGTGFYTKFEFCGQVASRNTIFRSGNSDSLLLSVHTLAGILVVCISVYKSFPDSKITKIKVFHFFLCCVFFNYEIRWALKQKATCLFFLHRHQGKMVIRGFSDVLVALSLYWYLPLTVS